MVYGDYGHYGEIGRLNLSVTVCLRMNSFWVRIIQAKQFKLLNVTHHCKDDYMINIVLN